MFQGITCISLQSLTQFCDIVSSLLLHTPLIIIIIRHVSTDVWVYLDTKCLLYIIREYIPV